MRFVVMSNCFRNVIILWLFNICFVGYGCFYFVVVEYKVVLILFKVCEFFFKYVKLLFRFLINFVILCLYGLLN